MNEVPKKEREKIGSCIKPADKNHIYFCKN